MRGEGVLDGDERRRRRLGFCGRESGSELEEGREAAGQGRIYGRRFWFEKVPAVGWVPLDGGWAVVINLAGVKPKTKTMSIWNLVFISITISVLP
jgi:hypothetical protein